MQFKNFLLFVLLFSTISLNAQKPIPPVKKTTVDKSKITIKTDHRQNVPRANPSVFDIQNANYNRSLTFQRQRGASMLQFTNDQASGLPLMILGELDSPNRSADSEVKCFEYLNTIKSAIRVDNPDSEFIINRQSVDQKGVKHIRMDQYFEGIKVHGGEVVLHEKDGAIFLFNGRYYPSPTIENIEPGLGQNAAELIVKTDLPNWQDLTTNQQLFIAHEQLVSELVIYHFDKQSDQELLAWHISAIPSLVEKWEYFIDANSGEILRKFSDICKIHTGACSNSDHSHETAIAETPASSSNNFILGPETAQATDLQGITRTINVYETGGTYFMIDASRPMFNASLSDFPNTPSGVVWSIDAFNTAPQNSNFTYDHVTSNNNSWNNPTAVSAQYNGGLAYEYFKSTFGRESINGNGGNIISFINVADENGNSMDNAFWNGTAMFYGNGSQAFTAPLAKASDVAGHEMSHGVIQNEANLEYQYESGALNESFADIFGAMIDRNDWKIGEEIANSSVFPSGTMRDMQDPHNGGTSSNFYWQPSHVNEMYTGNQDNGGVHINSGIPNHAYYLFATAIGKDKAEEIYYDVLTNYLVASSQFIDLRYAVVQATIMEYGNGSSEVDAANNAFNAVGIGEGGGNDYQDDVSVNPGNDFIMWSDLGLNAVNNSQPDGTFDGTFSNTSHISRPSITDDGSIILFIDEDNNMVEVDIDWSTGEILNEYLIESSGIWRNVATSKDGSKLAGITTDNDNQVFVFDFNSQSSVWFELYNPTTAEGVSTGDVQFPDVLEWDFSGEYVLYDAFNIITGQSSNIEYWDIGFIKVWDDNSNNFSDGFVSKLFSGLPENVSIGNPTFSKNSPYIIAYDFIESTSQGTSYEVQGANIQTGDQGTIWQNNTLGYPSYSIEDDEIIFSTFNGNDPIIGIRGLADDKINGTGDAFLLIENAEWATWFATGDRSLTSTEDQIQELGIAIYPNPVEHTLIIQSDGNLKNGQFEVYDLMGRVLINDTIDSQTSTINLSSLATGSYLIKIFNEEQMAIKKIMKL